MIVIAFHIPHLACTKVSVDQYQLIAFSTIASYVVTTQLIIVETQLSRKQ